MSCSQVYLSEQHQRTIWTLHRARVSWVSGTKSRLTLSVRISATTVWSRFISESAIALVSVIKTTNASVKRSQRIPRECSEVGRETSSSVQNASVFILFHLIMCSPLLHKPQWWTKTWQLITGARQITISSAHLWLRAYVIPPVHVANGGIKRADDRMNS